VVYGAAAQSLAAGRRGYAGGWWRPLGLDLGPLGPIFVGEDMLFRAMVVLPRGGAAQ
jgi:hypothetical protein